MLDTDGKGYLTQEEITKYMTEEGMTVNFSFKLYLLKLKLLVFRMNWLHFEQTVR